MKQTRIAIVLWIAVALSGCLGHKPAPQDTVFSPALQARDKARAVQGVLDAAGRRERRAIDSATGDKPPGAAP